MATAAPQTDPIPNVPGTDLPDVTNLIPSFLGGKLPTLTPALQKKLTEMGIVRTATVNLVFMGLGVAMIVMGLWTIVRPQPE